MGMLPANYGLENQKIMLVESDYTFTSKWESFIKTLDSEYYNSRLSAMIKFVQNTNAPEENRNQVIDKIKNANPGFLDRTFLENDKYVIDGGSAMHFLESIAGTMNPIEQNFYSRQTFDSLYGACVHLPLGQNGVITNVYLNLSGYEGIDERSKQFTRTNFPSGMLVAQQALAQGIPAVMYMFKEDYRPVTQMSIYNDPMPCLLESFADKKNVPLLLLDKENENAIRDLYAVMGYLLVANGMKHITTTGLEGIQFNDRRREANNKLLRGLAAEQFGKISSNDVFLYSGLY